MTKTHIKLVSEADVVKLFEKDFSVHDGIDWFNSLASAPEVGEAVYFIIDHATLWRQVEKRQFDETPGNQKFLLYTTPQQDRTAQLEDKVKRLVELCNCLEKELREARDDVNECLNADLPNAGYPRYDRRIEFRQQHLQRIDALLAEMEANG